MLSLEHGGQTLCDRVSRRKWLGVGSLSALGLSLPSLFALRAQAEASQPKIRQRAQSCIQIFLWGGPCAHETFDLKPDAPEMVRGAAQPIATSVPGLQFAELLPGLATRADKLCIVRSLAHTGVNHGTSAYHMLTGHEHWAPGTLREVNNNKDRPNVGCNAARFLEHPRYLPEHVHVPSVIKDGNELPVPGQGPALLGHRRSALRVLGDLCQEDFRVDELALAAGLTPMRLRGRERLRSVLADRIEHLTNTNSARSLRDDYGRALELLGSAETARAFDLGAESAGVRERYGRHLFGQSLLMARRLVEAGVPFVSVYWNPYGKDSVVDFEENWDTHKNEHKRLKEKLLPPFDTALSALLDDLVDRGLLDQTLVTWFGEFGRTPKVDRYAGRGHWGFCQSIGLAGGGLKQGMVHGSSTRDGGYPQSDAVTPDDLAATVYHCLGIDHQQVMHDPQGRPIHLSYGKPISAVLA